MAGLAVGNSAERREMLSAVRPIQSVMLMVFFLSIGLLIDLGFIWRNLGTVFLFFLIVTFFKTGINVLIIRVLGENWQRAFLSGVMISQIGEFSFLLAAAGLTVGAISVEESRLVITVTALSLGLSPFWLSTARRLQIIASRGVVDWNKILSSTFVLQRALFRWLTRRTRPSIKFLITQLKILLGSLRNRK